MFHFHSRVFQQSLTIIYLLVVEYLNVICCYQMKHFFFRIISVGGDGMLSEVMNGVLEYQKGQHQILTSSRNNKNKPIVLGIIPAGVYNIKFKYLNV